MRFEIDKKEYELKLTFGNIYELNKNMRAVQMKL